MKRIPWKLIFAYLIYPLQIILLANAEIESNLLQSNYILDSKLTILLVLLTVLIEYGPYAGVASYIRFFLKKEITTKKEILFLLSFILLAGQCLQRTVIYLFFPTIFDSFFAYSVFFWLGANFVMVIALACILTYSADRGIEIAESGG
ncbi:MAG: hypothetical protein LBJ36_04655 [Synergistaceae bacterium]|jgi:hypothetical protein|nr:hypothetical protein [Synergistaceae bacterium]